MIFKYILLKCIVTCFIAKQKGVCVSVSWKNIHNVDFNKLSLETIKLLVLVSFTNKLGRITNIIDKQTNEIITDNNIVFDKKKHKFEVTLEELPAPFTTDLTDKTAVLMILHNNNIPITYKDISIHYNAAIPNTAVKKPLNKKGNETVNYYYVNELAIYIERLPMFTTTLLLIKNAK